MQRLIQEAQDLVNARLTAAQLTAFDRYAQALLEWNRRMNLTAIHDPQEVRVKHFLDSLSCLLALRGSPAARVVDVGAGAGFPGLPLKIVCPDIRLTLVESISKKTTFLQHIVQVLGLDAVEVVTARAEEIGRQAQHRDVYDWALARAVAPLPVLVEYLLPLVRLGGKMLAQKGISGPAEAHAAQNAIALLGGQLDEIIPVTLPGIPEERFLVVIKKVAATPDKYPRRVGIPVKRPLT
ncbi:MAG: 16S rRNA (guanine(527)-N(7))-methyltransferase RsmG [Anaerolineae bacterium]|nr:16S rRNA (guanine(527)-N(7))-methyltransferase RsmG [Anaerolineae bacterium]